MIDRASLLALYDAQLRAEAEVPNADGVIRLGPLYLAIYGGRRGFVTYASLAGIEGAPLDTLISDAVAHFAAVPGIAKFEWKTRGHDLPRDLPERLLAAGFVAEDEESVMIGEASALAIDVPLPEGFTLGRVSSASELAEVGTVDALIFGDSPEETAAYLDELTRRFEKDADSFELWAVRNAGGEVVCTGRLDPVAGTDFAGIWGGGCLEEYRGRGLYRALSAARARSALARGKRYIHSDSTEYSRPILERAGLVKVTTTTPFIWTRG